MDKQFHIPVLLNECLYYLVSNPNGVYFDGTIGFGGHSEMILQKLSSEAVLIGTDVDKFAFEFSQKKFEADSRVRLYNYNFSKIDVVSRI